MKVERSVLAPQPLVGLHEVVALTELSSFFDQVFATVAAQLGRQGLAAAGPPTAIYQGETLEKIDVTAGFPVNRMPAQPGGLATVTLPGGPAITAVHIGPYHRMARAHSLLLQWMAREGIEAGPVMWEQYLIGPRDERDPHRWITRIAYKLS